MTLVALIDGPLPANYPGVSARASLAVAAPGTPAERHALAMAETIRAGAPDAVFICIAIFDGRLSASAGTLAAALDAAIGSTATIVHCSAGLARPDRAVIDAAQRTIAAGRRLIAASPARGDPVWPAAVTGVLAVQGDARCRPEEWSLLDSSPLFGACPQAIRFPDVAGASIAAAHFTGLLAARVPGSDDPVGEMLRDAQYFGRERRISTEDTAVEK